MIDRTNGIIEKVTINLTSDKMLDVTQKKLLCNDCTCAWYCLMTQNKTECKNFKKSLMQ
jgi:hypothetical protein